MRPQIDQVRQDLVGTARSVHVTKKNNNNKKQQQQQKWTNHNNYMIKQQIKLIKVLG